MSYGSILVPLDGSRFAESALSCAVRLARSAHANVRLVLVHDLAMAAVAAGPVAEHPEDWAVLAQEKSYLADVAARLDLDRADVMLEFRTGHAAEELERCIAERAPELVVMATHGRGSLAPLWLGSVADYLLRTVSVPILLVRPSDVPCRFRAVLVPTDFSDDSLTILEPVTRFARLTQAHITLLHVVGVNGQNGGRPLYRQPPAPDDVQELTADAQHRLDQLADRLRADGLRAAARVVSGTDIAGTILAQIDATPADFLALTTHGAGGFRDRLLGSVADKVIRSSTAPVLVLRPAVRP